ncbi:MAG: LysR family transcriptional regulator [Sphingomonadales bacterium]|nr:LysR family transcriptional regulator [Sphingomonadales bacterium]
MSKNQVDWDCHQAFLTVLDTGSFSAAARTLGLAQPTVRNRIDILESLVGTPLFVRTASGVNPTPQALTLADSARRMDFAARHFQRAAAGAPERIEGVVRLSVPDSMGIEVMPTLLAPLLDSCPGLTIELSITNAMVDLLNLEADIAIRLIPSTQSALRVQRVCRIPVGFFASSAYLARHGCPASLAELADHVLIGPDRAPTDVGIARQLATAVGKPLRFAIQTDSHPAQFAAARAGLGIAAIPVHIGRRDMVRVLPDITITELDAWVATHEDLRHSPRIDTVFRHLVAVMRNEFR